MRNPGARAQNDRLRSGLGRALNWAGWALFAGLLLLTWPNTLGGQTGYVIVSGHSMEKTYFTGDLVITRSTSHIRVGDVIVYKVPNDSLGAGMSVVHRVVGGDLSSGLTTKGDNNPSTDVWHPTAKDVRGVVRVHIPAAGRLLIWLRSPLALAALAALAAGWLLWPAHHRDLPEEEGHTAAEDHVQASAR